MPHKFIRAADLPAFDQDAKCPKCGYDTFSVFYHLRHKAGSPCMSSSTWVLDEHLCQVCGRCGFGWPEATVNVKPARRPVLHAVSPDDTEPGEQPHDLDR